MLLAVYLQTSNYNSVASSDSNQSNQISSLSLYSLYHAEACNEFAEPIFEPLPFGQHNSTRRNVVAGVTGWQNCI